MSQQIYKYICFTRPWIIGITIALLLYGQTIQSWYGPIDDHWIVSWLGPMHSLTVGQIWNELSTIRFGFFSGREAEYRARPLFFCYWLLETALFGDHPYFYYTVRLLYFGIFLGSLIWLATPTLGIIVATLATVLFALQVFWAQIWVYSLGVLEQLAVLGFAITVVGYGNLISDWVRGNSRASRGIVSVSVGTAIAVGCKENFLFLLFPLAVTLIALYRRRRLALTDFVISLPFLSFSLISLIRVLYLFMTISVDAYGADSSLGHRIHILIASHLFVIFSLAAGVSAPTLSLIALKKSPLDRASLVPIIQVFVAGVVILSGFVVWEIFIYNGLLPSAANRYAFPFRLIPLLIVGAFTSFLVVVFPSCRRWGRLIPVLWLGLVAILKPHTIDIWSVFNQTKEKVLVTQRFRDALSELAIAAGAHPTWPILIEASSPWDNEIVSTFNTWTRYKGIVNPVILYVAIPNDKLRSPFESELVDVMNTWASQGLIGHFVPFDRLAGLVAEGHCFDADGVIHIVKTAVGRIAKDKSCIQISSVR